MTTLWRLAREDACWVGPITYTATDIDGEPVDDVTVQFAVIPRGSTSRPADTDWTAPAANADDPTKLGVRVAPVTGYSRFGVWARATRGTDVIVLDPSLVGYIDRA